MPIEVTCECGAQFSARDELAGKSSQCITCGKKLRIPGLKPQGGAVAPLWQTITLAVCVVAGAGGFAAVAYQISSLSQRFGKQQDSVTANTEANQKLASEINQKQASFTKQQVALSKQQVVLGNQHSVFTTKQASLDSRLKQVQVASSSALGKLAAQEMQAKAAEKQREIQRNNLQTLKKEVSTQVKLQGELTARLETLENKSRELQQSVETEQALRTAALKKAEKGFEEKVKAHDKRIVMLNTELAKQVEAEKKVKQELADANQKVADLDSKINLLRNQTTDIALLRSEIVDLRNELNSLVSGGGVADQRWLKTIVHQNRTGARPVVVARMNTRSGRTRVSVRNATGGLAMWWTSVIDTIPPPSGDRGRYDMRVGVDSTGNIVNLFRLDTYTGRCSFLDSTLPWRWRSYWNPYVSSDTGESEWSIAVSRATGAGKPLIMLTYYGNEFGYRIVWNRGTSLVFAPF